MFARYVMAPLAAAALAAGFAPARADTVVKVGIINSYTGFVAQAADEMQKGIDLYAKLHDKDLPDGVKVEIVKRDDTSNPEVGKRVAQELITRDKVQLLAGLILSPSAAAIAPLTAEAKVPLVITNAAGVSIPRLSPYIVQHLLHAAGSNPRRSANGRRSKAGKPGFTGAHRLYRRA